MKQSRYYLAFFIFFVSLQNLTAQISYTFSLSDGKMISNTTLGKDGKEYLTIKLDKYFNIDIPGVPSLPVKYVNLIIPAMQDVKKIDVTFIVKEKVFLSKKILPAQTPIPTIEESIDNGFVKPDTSIYDSQKPFPQNIVEYLNDGYLDGNNHIASLRIIPFQYYPGIIYSIGCDQIPFDDYETDVGVYNLGESYLVGNANNGGVAFLGNTRYGWVSSSYLLFSGFADLIRNGSLHLGVAELISKYNYSGHYLRYSHNLLGCPETEIYTSVPIIQKDYFQTENVTNDALPNEYGLLGNYPNPFNPSTTIKVVLPYKSDVHLKIFDMLGNEIRTFDYSENPAGYLEIFWDGKNSSGQTVSSGVYLYSVTAVSKDDVRKEFSGSSKLLIIK